MLHRRSILNAVFVAVIILAAGAAFVVWRHQQRAALVLRGVPKIPDLSRWHASLSNEVSAATVQVMTAKDPVDPLGRLACLYLANGYAGQALQSLRTLAAARTGERALGILAGVRAHEPGRNERGRIGDPGIPEAGSHVCARMDSAGRCPH